jgi:nitric oxide reductase NorE protein
VASTATAAAPHRRIPGEEGIWVFVLGDMTVFALFFATFMYSRGRNHDAFARDHESMNVLLGTVNTVLLLTSSLFVAIAVQYSSWGRHRQLPALFGGALACGLGFIVVKAIEWTHLLNAGKTLVSSEYFSYYFIFTGVHLLHVVIGIAVLLGLIALSRRAQLSERQTVRAAGDSVAAAAGGRVLETAGIYWHMVDLLWVVLFALFYMVR